MGPLTGRTPAWGGLWLGVDSSSGGQLYMDWLATCPGPDTPLPPRAFRSAGQRGQHGSWLLPRRPDSPSGRGICRLGLGVEAALTQPVAVATLASMGTSGRTVLGVCQMEGEEAALSPAWGLSAKPGTCLPGWGAG